MITFLCAGDLPAGRQGTRPHLSADQSASGWAPARGSHCYAHTLRRSRPSLCHNDAPLESRLGFLADHCAQERTRTSIP